MSIENTTNTDTEIIQSAFKVWIYAPTEIVNDKIYTKKKSRERIFENNVVGKFQNERNERNGKYSFLNDFEICNSSFGMFFFTIFHFFHSLQYDMDTLMSFSCSSAPGIISEFMLFHWV